MSSSEVLIKADNVSKKFCRRLKRALWYGVKDLTSELVGCSNSHDELRKDEFWAVDDLSFELRRGECLGLIGQNGAGKSTLLKMLNGLIKPDKGQITIRGHAGALIELGAGFNPILTGRENIYVNAAVLGIPKAEIDKKLDVIIEFAEIEDFIDTPVQHYSSGMKVRLGFAVAIQMEPDLLLIDEVLAVGDLGFKVKCLNAINELTRDLAVVFVSHSMEFVSLICTKVIVLSDGKVMYHDTDVAAGIDYYHSMFEYVDQSVSGSGKAEVSDVHVSSGDRYATDEELLPLDYSDDLTVEMTLSLDSSISHVAIRVVIWWGALRPVAECFSRFSGFEIAPKRFSRVKLTLRNLCLNMGIYSIHIVVCDSLSGEILFRNDYAARFQVRATYPSSSPFLLRGEWEEEVC